MAKRIPEWTKYIRVDQVIECMPIGYPTYADDDAGRAVVFNNVQAELLTLMPHAYESGWTAETPPEPDAEKKYKLAKIWNKLGVHTQRIIRDAYDYERAELKSVYLESLSQEKGF